LRKQDVGKKKKEEVEEEQSNQKAEQGWAIP